eukprot:1143786-Pelagomonas_calceolata.AAC.2
MLRQALLIEDFVGMAVQLVPGQCVMDCLKQALYFLLPMYDMRMTRTLLVLLFTCELWQLPDLSARKRKGLQGGLQEGVEPVIPTNQLILSAPKIVSKANEHF